MAANPALVTIFLQGKDEQTRELVNRIYASLQESGGGNFAKSLLHKQDFYNELFEKVLVPIFYHEASESQAQEKLKSLQESLISVIKDIFQLDTVTADLNIIEEMLNKLNNKIIDMWFTTESLTESIHKLCNQTTSELSGLKVKYVYKYEHCAEKMLKPEGDDVTWEQLQEANRNFHLTIEKRWSEVEFANPDITEERIDDDNLRQETPDSASSNITSMQENVTMAMDELLKLRLATEQVLSWATAEVELANPDSTEESTEHEKQETPERSNSSLSSSPRGVGLVSRIGDASSSRGSSPVLGCSSHESNDKTATKTFGRKL